MSVSVDPLGHGGCSFGFLGSALDRLVMKVQKPHVSQRVDPTDQQSGGTRGPAFRRVIGADVFQFEA